MVAHARRLATQSLQMALDIQGYSSTNLAAASSIYIYTIYKILLKSPYVEGFHFSAFISGAA